MDVDESKRNIIISHQFVTGVIKCDSEEISLGGTDNVDVAVYDKFDYVALGHIHSPQKLIRDTVGNYRKRGHRYRYLCSVKKLR